MIEDMHGQAVGSAAQDGPDDACFSAVARSSACIALIGRDGRFLVLSRRLTRDLGLEAPEDLFGLQLRSFWHPSERNGVDRAFACALRGHHAGADVDLSYAATDAGPARVAFAPGPAGGTILMTLDRPPAAN